MLSFISGPQYPSINHPQNAGLSPRFAGLQAPVNPPVEFQHRRFYSRAISAKVVHDVKDWCFGSLCIISGLYSLTRARRGRPFRRERRRPAALANVDTRIGQKVDTSPTTSHDMWVVLVHAPIRSCRMPLCKIPGLKKAVCACLRDGAAPPSRGGPSVRSRDGRCALTVAEYAEVLAEGVPVLSRSQAYGAATRLFESALANETGAATVISAFRKAAEEYERRLLDLGLSASVARVGGD